MQYVITLPRESVNTDRFANLLSSEDPSAVLDHAQDAQSLRLSTCLSKHELQSLADEAGMAVDAQAITLLPSDCCGGCGG